MKKLIPLLTIILFSCQKDELIEECPEIKLEIQAVEGNLMYGDIIMNPNKAVASKVQLWPGGIIPYRISGFESEEDVLNAIAVFEEKTDLVFYPATDEDENVLHFKEVFHWISSSHLGMIGGEQEIRISTIADQSVVEHEIMHALGFLHNFNRPDRDKWINVHYENIYESSHPNYEVYPGESVEMFTSVLDTNSVTGYGSYQSSFVDEQGFPIPDKPAMTWKDGSTWKRGETLSEGDISAIQKLYKCEF